tara:strand:+ start:651 stop:956 length:306 start_codon:yes stop_codon:yes gene_type:complete
MSTKIDDTMEQSIRIILDQCEIAIKYDKEVLIKLLNINNNDIANTIIDIQENNVEKKLTSSEDDINWELLLSESKFNPNIIRKLFDQRDRSILASLERNNN